MKRLLVLLLILLSSCSAGNDALTAFEVEMPRAFGYLIGDEITQRIVLDARPGIALNSAGLPAPGPINRWLNLNRLDVRQRGGHYQIELRYQVFYAPLAVKTLTLPGFDLRFGQGDDAFTKAVPPWRFTMSPLRDLALKSADNERALRPNSPPPLLSTRPALRLGTAGLILALAASAALGYLYGYFPIAGRRTLFKQALRRLARMTERDMAEALRTVHHALNTLHRQPLFHHQLADFYRQYPEYRPVAAQLDGFFHYSNHYFFSRNVSAAPLDLQKLVALCRVCRQIERGSR